MIKSQYLNGMKFQILKPKIIIYYVSVDGSRTDISMAEHGTQVSDIPIIL